MDSKRALKKYNYHRRAVFSALAGPFPFPWVSVFLAIITAAVNGDGVQAYDTSEPRDAEIKDKTTNSK